jgi:hypothetical protein
MNSKNPPQDRFSFCWDYCVTEVKFGRGTEHENGKRFKMEVE